ncbi:hypothetical protein E2C01_039253 [Portunus trituberculatus]|uniref:Uncharacterized protein n=1 Tax=Portunus trituberculatus TaxID=210409 RepID=A0A5B7FEA5_PORTR|nr:hypothetical protein [Portunus trituberculatus]
MTGESGVGRRASGAIRWRCERPLSRAGESVPARDFLVLAWRAGVGPPLRPEISCCSQLLSRQPVVNTSQCESGCVKGGLPRLVRALAFTMCHILSQ